MARKLIENFWTANVAVKVYWDSEWQEYTCRLFVNGKYMNDVTYFTNDKEDAISTASDMLSRAYEDYKTTGDK